MYQSMNSYEQLPNRSKGWEEILQEFVALGRQSSTSYQNLQFQSKKIGSFALKTNG